MASLATDGEVNGAQEEYVESVEMWHFASSAPLLGFCLVAFESAFVDAAVFVVITVKACMPQGRTCASKLAICICE